MLPILYFFSRVLLYPQLFLKVPNGMVLPVFCGLRVMLTGLAIPMTDFFSFPIFFCKWYHSASDSAFSLPKEVMQEMF